MKIPIKKLYDFTYRAAAYCVGSSSMAGLNNAITEITEQDDFYHNFGQGYVNHFSLAIWVGSTYNPLFSLIKDKKRFRLYANIYHGTIMFGMLAWHYYTGTENPIQTMLPITAVTFPILNKHVDKTLEEKIR